MSVLIWPNKTPEEVLDYGINWLPQLGSDTIATSTWSVPPGITKESDSHDGKTVQIQLSGGSANRVYLLTNTIATSLSQEVIDQVVQIVVSSF